MLSDLSFACKRRRPPGRTRAVGDGGAGHHHAFGGPALEDPGTARPTGSLVVRGLVVASLQTCAQTFCLPGGFGGGWVPNCTFDLLPFPQTAAGYRALTSQWCGSGSAFWFCGWCCRADAGADAGAGAGAGAGSGSAFWFCGCCCRCRCRRWLWISVLVLQALLPVQVQALDLDRRWCCADAGAAAGAGSGSAFWFCR